MQLILAAGLRARPSPSHLSTHFVDHQSLHLSKSRAGQMRSGWVVPNVGSLRECSLILALLAVAVHSPISQAQTLNDYLIVPRERIDPMSLGMSATALAQMMGTYMTVQGLHVGSTDLSVVASLGKPKYSRVFSAWWGPSYSNLYWPGMMMSAHLKGYDNNHSVWKICVNHFAAIAEWEYDPRSAQVGFRPTLITPDSRAATSAPSATPIHPARSRL
jgi:hypothetical protein